MPNTFSHGSWWAVAEQGEAEAGVEFLAVVGEVPSRIGSRCA